MEDYTIVEKYQHQKQSSSIAVRPYFNPGKENMGLETYGLSLHDGVFHEESLACLEMNGVKRYVTGLNEFAPDVKMLPAKEKKAKITEIRNAERRVKTRIWKDRTCLVKGRRTLEESKKKYPLLILTP